MSRPSSTATKAQVSKVFRCNYSSIPVATFTEQVGDEELSLLDRNMSFFKDIWELDKYVAESVLVDGMKLAWPRVSVAQAKVIVKSVKTVLSLLHLKKKKITSGAKSPVLKKFLHMVGELDAEAEVDLQSNVQQQNVQQQNVHMKKASTSVAELYGFPAASNACQLPLSQITISDDTEVEDDPAQPTFAGGTAIESTEVLIPASSTGHYFDYQAMCLTRLLPGGGIEKSKLKPGDDGFAVAEFADGTAVTTTVPNVEVFPPCLKRPAANLKRPAACLEKPAVAESDEGADGGGSSLEETLPLIASTEAPHWVKPRAGTGGSNVFRLENGCVLKLGKFKDKSYITYMEPHMEKFTLLVGCSDAQAARNGKHHHDIIGEVWSRLKASPDTLPEKGNMKALVLELLAV